MAEKIKPTQEAKLNRKGNKPQMEKRRRARINHHLEQLAGLLFEGRKKDSNRHSKLEKADILEMTVRHVKELQNRLNLHSITSDPNLHSRYSIGYTECASEVTRYLNSAESIDEGVRTRITDHLVNSIHVTTGGATGQQKQDSKPVLRVENNLENNNNERNAPSETHPVMETEPSVKQELLSPVASRTSPSPTVNQPMKSLQVTVPNSLNLSRISIPVLGSSNKTLLSPQTAAISIGDNFAHSVSLTRPDNCKAPQSTVLASVPNLGSSPETTSVQTAMDITQSRAQYFHRPQSTVMTAVPNLGSPPETTVVQATMDIPQSRGQYFHQPKPSISVQPFLTTVRATSNPPSEIVKTTLPSTRPMDKSATSVSEPLLLKLSPSQVAGSFQIIPGSLYNGQPVALYLAPTSALPTMPEYMSTAPVTTAVHTVTTATPTTESDTLSVQMPQVVTAVVSPPTLGLLSPQAAAPAPTILSGSTCFGHASSSLPISASVPTSTTQNPSTFASTSGQPLPVSYPQRIETGNHVPGFHANHMQSPESDQRVWRPW